MFERFTDRARKMMAYANEEAQRWNHEYIGTEHMLIGLIKEGSGVGANVLKNLGVELPKVRTEVEKLVKKGSKSNQVAKLPQMPAAKRAIEYALEESRNLSHNYVGTEHMLLGLLRESDSVAGQVLTNLGLKIERVREEVLNLLPVALEPVALGPSRRPDRADAKSSEECCKDDVAGKLMLELVRELERRRHEAVTKREYEIATEYRDLALGLRTLLDRLASILGRQEPPPG